MGALSIGSQPISSTQPAGAPSPAELLTPRPLRRRLSPQDAAFLFFDSEEAPLNLGAVGIFEGEIPYDRFVENVLSKLHLVPRYRQRAVPAPFNVGRPTWECDPDFDIYRHIYRVRLPPPGSDEQLMDLAARVHQGRLDRSKPLWEIYFVEGLQGGRTGMVSKVHHCLVDGVAGIELLMITLDVSPEPAPTPPPAEPYEPPPIPGWSSLFVDALLDGLSERLDRWAGMQHGLVDLALGGDITRARRVRRALEVAIPYFALPVDRAPFNQPLSGQRKLTGSDFSFDEVRAIRRACGGTVNDVVLAVLGGALGRYLELRGQPAVGRLMRILTPVNVRRQDESGAMGNRVSMLLVEVPVGPGDPVERVRVIAGRTGPLKRGRVADGVEALADALLGMPAPLVAAFAAVGPPPNSVANMVCTNVPGPMIPLYTVGHRMLAGWPIVPLGWEMGIGCAVTSYNHRLYFGLMADARAAPDVHRLKELLDESYMELRTAAGVPEMALPIVEAAAQVATAPERRAA